MKASKLQAWWTAALLLACSGSASAHIVAARLGDFYTGALHPLTDLQDIVLWLGLGILAGSIGGAQGRWLVVVMPLGLLAGLGIKLGLGLGDAGTVANAAMMVFVGLLLAARVRLNAAALCAIAFLLASMRGAVNAGGIGPETNRVLFAVGLATAGYAAITLVMAVTVAFRRPYVDPAGGWRGVAVRVCGSWIAAIGLMIGGFALKSATG